MTKDRAARARSGYWIRFHHYECPVCGGGREDEQERIYDQPKPDGDSERYIFHHRYDQCIEWGGLYA